MSLRVFAGEPGKYNAQRGFAFSPIGPCPHNPPSATDLTWGSSLDNAIRVPTSRCLPPVGGAPDGGIVTLPNVLIENHMLQKLGTADGLTPSGTRVFYQPPTTASPSTTRPVQACSSSPATSISSTTASSRRKAAFRSHSTGGSTSTARPSSSSACSFRVQCRTRTEHY